MSVDRDFPGVTDRVTQDNIDAYAELSGDFNPLHVDPEAAAASEFGGIIAHGPVALHSFFRSATAWLGTAALPPGSKVSVVYRAPTRPGDEVTCELRELAELDDGRAALQADCVNQDGTTVVSVTAELAPLGA
ncbi:MAG: MaoC/PaaZ C-terminal domain-containing protein [Solirubrobacterales bacterium]